MADLQSNKPQIIKSLIVMRHGERIDSSNLQNYAQILPKYDPELTENGINQAQDVAKQIKKSIKNNKDKISTLNIYCSPFTRTIMTGLNVALKLNLENNNLFIVNSLFEIATKNNFEFFPLNSLLINNKSDKKNEYEKFIDKTAEKIKNLKIIKYKEKFDNNDIKYPEEFKDAIDRYKKIGEELFDEISKNGNNNINIIVTHGYGVQVITEFFFGKTPNKDELLNNEIFLVDYCTSYCFNFINNNQMKFIGRIEPSFD